MTNKKRLFLGMPGHGGLSAAAARGFWRGSRNFDTAYYYQEGSLLANNFNALWCHALNLKGDLRPDYFAMQHSDVEPEDLWIETLIDELEENDLDVLSVVLPIKDSNGVTSTALATPGDYWRPLCRLTMTEIAGLPETFTSLDTGHPLLLNTGLWVCRFGDWVEQVHFTINDRIVQNRKTGEYFAEVEPEDWYFSRLLHELGLTIGVTRKIKALHRGAQAFANFNTWGQEFDSAYVEGSQLADRNLVPT